jgi:hypothetical protein
LDDLKEVSRYWKLKNEALDCTVWRTDFGKGFWETDYMMMMMIVMRYMVI